MRKLVAPLVFVIGSFACSNDSKQGSDVDASETTLDTSAEDSLDTTLPDLAKEVEVEVEVTPIEPWRHVGPITVDAARDTTAKLPLFAAQALAIPAEVVLPEGRAMVVDFDHDGREDLVVLGTTNGMAPTFLRNATTPGGAWHFEDFTAQAGMVAPMVLLVFGDLDNDGDADAFSGTSFRSGADGKHGIWLNDGAGHFTYSGTNGLAPRKQSGQFYKEMAAATLADLDRDGNLDLYVTMWNVGMLNGTLGVPTDDELYKGDGHGQFAQFALPDQHNPLTSQMDPGLAGVPRRGYGLCPADYDDDGDLDLFVNNYGAGRPAADDPPLYWDWNLLWRNDGSMAFVDVAVPSKVHATVRGINAIQEETPVVFGGVTYPGPIGGNGFGCSWGDFDNDGDLDLVVGQIAHPDYPQTDRLLLHVNPGGAPGSDRVFGEESNERGLQYYEDELHPVLVDVDMDGRLDLAVSRLRGGSKWEVYLQERTGNLKKFEMQDQVGSGVDIVMPGPTVWLDVDGDGDLDFFMPKGPTGQLFENVAATANYLVVELFGQSPKSPRDATGARMTLSTSVGKHVRELVGGTGHYNSQQTRELHVGLGADSGAHDVQIRWPDGEVQVLGDVKANVHLVVEQGGAIRLR